MKTELRTSVGLLKVVGGVLDSLQAGAILNNSWARLAVAKNETDFPSETVETGGKNPRNKLFYSCVLSDLALNWKRGWGALVLIQTTLLFMCRSCCSNAN